MVSRSLKSWAMPPVSWPIASSRCDLRRTSSCSTWRVMSRLRKGSRRVHCAHREGSRWWSPPGNAPPDLRRKVTGMGWGAHCQAFLECPDAPHLRFVLVEAAGHQSELLWHITEHPRHRGIAQGNHARSTTRTASGNREGAMHDGVKSRCHCALAPALGTLRAQLQGRLAPSMRARSPARSRAPRSSRNRPRAPNPGRHRRPWLHRGCGL